jgi:hypothetical protein
VITVAAEERRHAILSPSDPPPGAAAATADAGAAKPPAPAVMPNSHARRSANFLKKTQRDDARAADSGGIGMSFSEWTERVSGGATQRERAPLERRALRRLAAKQPEPRAELPSAEEVRVRAGRRAKVPAVAASPAGITYYCPPSERAEPLTWRARPASSASSSTAVDVSDVEGSIAAAADKRPVNPIDWQPASVAPSPRAASGDHRRGSSYSDIHHRGGALVDAVVKSTSLWDENRLTAQRAMTMEEWKGRHASSGASFSTPISSSIRAPATARSPACTPASIGTPPSCSSTSVAGRVSETGWFGRRETHRRTAYVEPSFARPITGLTSPLAGPTPAAGPTPTPVAPNTAAAVSATAPAPPSAPPPVRQHDAWSQRVPPERSSSAGPQHLVTANSAAGMASGLPLEASINPVTWQPVVTPR